MVFPRLSNKFDALLNAANRDNGRAILRTQFAAVEGNADQLAKL